LAVEERELKLRQENDFQYLKKVKMLQSGMFLYDENCQ
jgi:hypothetical protein